MDRSDSVTDSTSALSDPQGAFPGVGDLGPKSDQPRAVSEAIETGMEGYGEARIGSAGWSIAGHLAATLIQIGGFVVLARYLGPHDFGVISVAAVLVGFSQIFTDLGIGPAVVANQSPTQGDLSAAFWLNALSGLVIAAIVAPCGFLLAAWFHLHPLQWVVPVLSLGFVLSVSVVSVALLERRFRFRTIAFVDVAAALVAQVVGIVLAESGHGLLGLALIPVVTAAGTSVLAFPLARWRPGLRFSRSEVASLRSYAQPLVAFNTMTFWARNIDNLLIGKLFGASQLAFYSRGYQLMIAPIQQVNFALGRFLQAAFASDVQDRERLERHHYNAETAVAVFGLTVSALIIPTADDFVRVVFGAAWHPMARLFAILAVSIAPQVVTSVNGALLRATGDTRLLLRLGTINSVLFVVAMSVASAWSVQAVAWSFDAVTVVTVPVTLLPICARLGFRRGPTFVAIARAVPLPAVLFGVLYTLSRVDTGGSALTRLGIEAAAAAIGLPVIGRYALRWYQRAAT